MWLQVVVDQWYSKYSYYLLSFLTSGCNYLKYHDRWQVRYRIEENLGEILSILASKYILSWGFNLDDQEYKWYITENSYNSRIHMSCIKEKI